MPVTLLKRLGVQYSRYGYTGMNDYMMYPMLRPGAWVLFDDGQNKIMPGGWRSDFDRPIYFFETREGFACCWCQLEGDQLTLVPHTESPCAPQHFLYPKEIDVIGRVVKFYTDAYDPGRTDQSTADSSSQSGNLVKP